MACRGAEPGVGINREARGTGRPCEMDHFSKELEGYPDRQSDPARLRGARLTVVNRVVHPNLVPWPQLELFGEQHIHQVLLHLCLRIV